MKRQLHRTVRGHHGRSLRVIGLKFPSSTAVGFTVVLRHGQSFRMHDRAVVWISRGNARVIRDALDRLLAKGRR